MAGSSSDVISVDGQMRWLEYAKPPQLKAYFCEKCACLLPLGGDGDYIQCDMCGHNTLVETIEFQEIESRSYKKTDRQMKRQAERTRDFSSDVTMPQRAQVDAICPKCDSVGLFFYTVQLRSADEGQTVFYDCPKCHHKFNES